MRINLNSKFKNRKTVLLAMLLLAGIALYFYFGSFFETGLDYYSHFMRNDNNTEYSVSSYAGDTDLGETTITMTTMKETDKHIEFSGEGVKREYVMESSTDGHKIRLFDGSNSLVFSGTLNHEKGVILSNETGEEISYLGYVPVLNENYNEENPDPILIIMMANSLNERYRGNLSMLIFAGLVFMSLIIDMIFPEFFFRLKTLNFRGEVVLPTMYTRMQKYSWMLSPVLIIIFLYIAL